MIKKFDGLYRVALIGLLINSLANAQDVNRLESIYVTDDIATSVNSNYIDIGQQDKISSEQISEEVAQSLDDILKKSPGATTKGGPRPVGETPQIRGLEANKIFVNIDGVKQTFYFSNHNFSFLTIDPDTIKAVDIYKSNTDYSEGISLGGGMSYRTKDGRDYLSGNEKNGSLVKYSFESASNLNAESVKSYGRLSSGDYLLSANLRKSKDLELSDGTTLENSAFDNYNLQAKFTFDISSKQNLKISAETFNHRDDSPLNATLDPPSSLKSLQGETKIQRDTLTLNYSNTLNENLNLNIDTYVSNQTNQQERDSDGRVENRDIESIGGKVKNKFVIVPNQTTVEVGTDLNFDKVVGNSTSGAVSDYPDGNRQELAAFAQGSYKKGSFLVSPGLRYTHYELDSKSSKYADVKDAAASAKLLLKYEKNGFDLFSSLSQGFNGPDVQEVYATGLHRPGDGFFIADNYFVPNPLLRPESSNTIEVGFGLKKQLLSNYDLLSFRFSGYQSYAKDYIDQEIIDYAIVDGKNGTTQFVNRKRVKLYGQEVSLNYLYNQFEFTSSYSRNVGWDRGRNIWLASMPANTYQLGLNYYLDNHGLKLGLESTIAQSQNRVNPGTLERITDTPGYTIYNVFATKNFQAGDLSGLSLTARIDNLTQKEYRRHGSFINEVGRNYKMSIQYKIKNF